MNRKVPHEHRSNYTIKPVPDSARNQRQIHQRPIAKIRDDRDSFTIAVTGWNSLPDSINRLKL
jgi:hypothetical protein